MQKNIPFDFVMDYLFPLEVKVKPMFGVFALYIGEKLVLMLRQRTRHPEINGVWIATSQEYHKSLRKAFPSLRSIAASSNGIAETEWQLFPVDTDDFEKSVIRACELIKQNDPRIGRIPKPRKPKTKTAHGTKKPGD